MLVSLNGLGERPSTFELLKFNMCGEARTQVVESSRKEDCLLYVRRNWREVTYYSVFPLVGNRNGAWNQAVGRKRRVLMANI